jgi:hypothetical protein
MRTNTRPAWGITRPFSIVALAAVLSVGLAASDAQTKPKPAPQKPIPQKPVPPKPVAAAAPVKPEPPPPARDVRVKTAYTHGPQISQNVTYLQGDRQRVEFPGVVTIEQCDLKRTVMLNTSAKRYRVQPHPQSTPAPAPPAAVDPFAQMGLMGPGAAPQPPPKGGVITITTAFSDTLERQEMFGLEARRVKTTIVKQASDKACDKSAFKMETDAWYVDLPAQSSCVVPALPAPPPPATDPGACTDRIESRTAGTVKLGFPVKSVITTTTGDGDKAEVTTVSQEVTELEITRLDRALFDVPPGYVEAVSGAEIVPALAGGGSLADALFGSTADGTSVAAPKKPGVIRVGILEPINRTERQLSPASLRQDLVSRFNKAPYEAIPVAGSSAAAVEQDAARLECDYLLFAEIVEIKTSKPGRVGGMMRRATGEAAKDSHEVKLNYKLFAAAATAAPKITGDVKASSGGFGVGSALRLAAFAGQMYLGMMGGGGMMNQMMAMSSSGAGPGGGGFFDPRTSAMNSLATGLDGGMPFGDMSDTEMRETVSEARGNSAKAAMEQLRKK